MKQTYILDGFVTALSPITVTRPDDTFAGGGHSEDLSRLPRVGAKRQDTTAYLPGATFRGKLRRACQDRIIKRLSSTGQPATFSLSEHYMQRQGVDTTQKTAKEKSDGLIDGEKKLREKNPLLSLFGRWKLSGHLSISGLIPSTDNCIFIDGDGVRTNDFIRSPEKINLLTAGEQKQLKLIMQEEAQASIVINEIKDTIKQLKKDLKNAGDAEKEAIKEKINKLEQSIVTKKDNKKVKESIQRPLPGYECFKPDTNFTSKISLFNATEHELGLFIETMSEFAQEPRIGGHRSADCGSISLEYDIKIFPELADNPIKIGTLRIDETGFTLIDDTENKELEKARENFIKALGENQFDFTEFLR